MTRASNKKFSARRIAAKVAKLPGLLKRPLLNTNACFLSQRDYLSATSLLFSNAGSNFIQSFETVRFAGGLGVTIKDKLQLAGLGLG